MKFSALLLGLLVCLPLAATTHIVDTLYRNGLTPVQSGSTIRITGPSVVSGSGQTVLASTQTVTVGTGGAVDFYLVGGPGYRYVATYYLVDSIGRPQNSFQETWFCPDTTDVLTVPVLWGGNSQSGFIVSLSQLNPAGFTEGKVIGFHNGRFQAVVNASVWGAITGTLSAQTDLMAALNGKAALSHTHVAADVTSGVFAIGLIPTGTSGVTVALGNHTHAGVYEPVISAGATSQYFRGDKTWRDFATDALAAVTWSTLTGKPATLVQTNQSNAYSTGTQDFSAAAHTLPMKAGILSAIPATCTVGESYFVTDATAGQNLYGCTATNTWTLQAGGGSSGGLTTTGDANYTILPTDRTVTHTAMSVSRTDTLPAASALTAGATVCVIDRSGLLTATKTLSLARAGSDTINGGTSSVVLQTAYASVCLVSDGASKWTVKADASTIVGTSGVTCVPVAGILQCSADTTVVAALPLTTINPQTATYQVLAADFNSYKTITAASGTFTITLVASGTQPAAGQFIRVVNYGSGVVTIARSGQNLNGGTASLTLPAASATAPTSAVISSDGTNYFADLAMPLSVATGDITCTAAGVCTASANLKRRAIGFAFDGGGSALTTSNVGYVTAPFACTISAWNMTLDTGTMTIDIWKIATGSAIPTVTNTITASALPAIASGTALHSTTLTGWTTAVSANDIFGFKVNAVASATRASIVLECNQ